MSWIVVTPRSWHKILTTRKSLKNGGRVKIDTMLQNLFLYLMENKREPVIIAHMVVDQLSPLIERTTVLNKMLLRYF